MKPLRVLNLGWGVQSWTLVAMAALDSIERPDVVIHADTGWEKQSTYIFAEKWTPWLKDRGINVVTVSEPNGDTRLVNAEESPGKGGVFIPAFTVSDNGTKGILRRQCTSRWKITPIRKYLRSLLGKVGPGCVEQWMGISLDEFQRMKDSDVKWIVNRYPLIEMRMSRIDCLSWLNKNNLPSPPKSSCVFCPYHSRGAWRDIDEDDIKTAIKIDNAIRNKRKSHKLYVHSSCIPLQDIQMHSQADMFDLLENDSIPCDSGNCFM